MYTALPRKKYLSFPILLLQTFSLSQFPAASREQYRKVKDCCIHLDWTFITVIRQ